MGPDGFFSVEAGRQFPLRLCEVLEREFVAIHGRLPVAPSWLLDDRDICFPKLVDSLRSPLRSPFGTAVTAIRMRLESAGFTIPPSGSWDRNFEERLREKINELLCAKENLYDHNLIDRHSAVWHLAELPLAEALAEERIQLNRLLLEAAFPAAVIARVDTVRTDRVFESVHALSGPEGVPSALCLSGGGIRSAAFGLGVLQALARCQMLEKFDYLSTVSGGGYAGSWLSTWIHRHPRGLSGVAAELRTNARMEADNRTRKLDPEPHPIRFLRSYSHFLNPRPGLFSADTWTWIGIYLRNLSLNWLLIIPLLVLVMAVPRLYPALLYVWDGDYFPLLVWIATLAALSTLVCAGINRPSLSDPAAPDKGTGKAQRVHPGRLLEPLKRQNWILVFGVLPLLLFAILLTLLAWSVPETKTPFSWDQIRALVKDTPFVHPRILAYIAFEHLVLWGELIVLAAWLISVVVVPRQGARRAFEELLPMLLAGWLTWLLVAGLAEYAGELRTDREEAFRLLSFTAYRPHLYSVLAPPAIVIAVLAGMTLFIGAVSKFRWIEDEDREWWGRFGAWVLVATVAWLVFSSITIFGPPLLLEFPRLIAAIGGVSGLVAVLIGRSSLTAAFTQRGGADQGGRMAPWPVFGANALATASIVFFAVLLAFVSLLTTAMFKELLAWWYADPKPTGFLVHLLRYLVPDTAWELKHACGLQDTWTLWRDASVFHDPRLHLELTCQTPLALIAGAMLVLALLLAGSAALINLNKFSLHAAYRIRIVRTFLGASRRTDRRPNPFTGFDPLDNVQMHELQPGLLGEADIIDLARLVDRLRRALMGESESPAICYLARHMVAAPYDPSGVLRSRLRSAEPDKPVLRALQKDLIETLNRMLETARLDRAEAFASVAAVGNPRFSERVDRYVGDRNVIFANRLLIQSALPEEIREYHFPPPPPHKLMHVLNLTLNLVQGSRLAWQERKAAPFVVTPMHAGSYYLGYRESRNYGGKDGISIGTAAAISGAAVSPNMGYSSSPITALLLTFFNVRLGWWLGNPGVAGTNTYFRAEPLFSLRPLLSEALGLTDDESPYVYLSDGGHFDNLGLFEMVLRRRRLIVAVDAGADPDYQFEDVGNAVRKIRIDLGVPIEFPKMPIYKRNAADGASSCYCALGRIRYSRIDGANAPDGVLICFKPVIRGGEPRDVLHYSDRNPLFPQESTADQFFGESQFESYRQLGEHAVQTVCGGLSAPAPGQSWAAHLVEAVRQHIDELPGASGPYSWLDNWLLHAAAGKAQSAH
jgi:hypothetical protein